MKYRVTKASMLLEVFDVEALSEAEAIRVAASTSGQIVSENAAWSVVRVGASLPVARRWEGFGVYLRRLSANDDPNPVADRCVRAGMAWAMFMVEANYGYVSSSSTLVKWAETFRARGLQVGVWSFPGDDRAASIEQSAAAGALLASFAADIDANLVMLNIEKPYKGKAAEMRALIEAVVSQIPATSRGACGVVSYPVPSMHSEIDWSQFSVFDFGSPMFYRTAEDPAVVERGMTEWKQYIATLTPTLDGWSGSGASGARRFAQDVETVCGPGPARVPGALVWSEAQMDDAKRAVTRETATKYEWPVS